jgi:uncharacterized repeat protein (TIGR01451 family)
MFKAIALLISAVGQTLMAGAPTYPCDVPNCVPHCMDGVSGFHVVGRFKDGYPSRLGDSRSVSGDFNGDGRPDLAVTERRQRARAEAPYNEVYVYLNQGTGYAATPDFVLQVAQPPLSNKNSEAFADLSAGDLDGDGYDELAFGYSDDEYTALRGHGQAWVFRGGPTGLDSNPAWTYRSVFPSDYFGENLAILPNFFGPGIGALAVGAPLHSENGIASTGRIYLFRADGSPGILGNAPVQLYHGETNFANLGQVLFNAGDVDGDGRSDLLAVATGHRDPGLSGTSGKIYLYLGAAVAPTVADWTDLGEYVAKTGPAAAQVGRRLRFSLGSGDFNGDGRSDIVVGMPYVDGYRGKVRVYPSVGGLPGPWTCLSHGQNNAIRFGIAVAGVGDIDRDGFEDLAVGQDAARGGIRGHVLTFAGSEFGLLSCVAGDIGPGLYVDNHRKSGYLGYKINRMGDVNNDGHADFLVSTMNYSDGIPPLQGQTQGRVDVVFTSGANCVLPPILSLHKSVDLTEADACDILTYTLVVSNALGAGAGRNVVLRDEIPSNTSFVSAEDLPGTADLNSPGVGARAPMEAQWTLPNLAPGQSVTLRFSVQVDCTLNVSGPIFEEDFQSYGLGDIPTGLKWDAMDPSKFEVIDFAPGDRRLRIKSVPGEFLSSIPSFTGALYLEAVMRNQTPDYGVQAGGALGALIFGMEGGFTFGHIAGGTTVNSYLYPAAADIRWEMVYDPAKRVLRSVARRLDTGAVIADGSDCAQGVPVSGPINLRILQNGGSHSLLMDDIKMCQAVANQARIDHGTQQLRSCTATKISCQSQAGSISSTAGTGGGAGIARLGSDDTIKSIQRRIPVGKSLVLAPNPAKGITLVCMDLPEAGQAQLEVSNVVGEKVASYNFGELFQGETCQTVNLGGLAPGIYFTQLFGFKDGGRREIGRFKLAIVR